MWPKRHFTYETESPRFFSLSYKNEWAKPILHRPIQDSRQQVSWTNLFWIPKFSYNVWNGKRRCKEFHPAFKTNSNTHRANKFLMENSLKEGSTPQFHPSLRDLGPLQTRHWEPVTLQAPSLVEKAELVQVRCFTLRLRDQRSMQVQDGCRVYMASNGSCFMVTWIVFKNCLLEVGVRV